MLRKKIISIIGVTLLGLILLLYVITNFILIGSFDKLEEQGAFMNTERARDALSSDIARLHIAVGDWAPWDDTYNFIIDANKQYIESNFGTSTMSNLKVNFVLFYNISGHLVYGTGLDLKTGEKIPIPTIFMPEISPDSILLDHRSLESSLSGIMIIPEGPILISSNPIITSDHKGPIRGTLIMGSFLDIEELSRITHLSLSFKEIDGENTSNNWPDIQKLSKEKPILIQPLNNDIIAGYIQLDDIEGKPSLVLKAQMPRGIHKQGLNTMWYQMISIVISGLVFGLVTLFLLEKNVLSRLAFLSSNVSAIGTSGNHSLRVSLQGDDELSRLASTINGMLGELEKAEEDNKKQLFLKEIYHRVKNNLQIIISLLNLQSQKTMDKNVIGVLKDSQNRIRSMALIHERLYRSKDLSGINISDYIHDLANNIFNSYGINPGRINLKIDIQDRLMNLDSATPCGLIITELVSNSLKHAFPNGKKGELIIKLISDSDNNFTLIVKDNGIGFPKHLDFRSTDTLGMQLVNELVNQLKGSIELDKNNGTEFKIKFKEKM
ncbi:MAG: ATP-binding protein [Candidatus Methanoperedens sp.]|nr:ATP-binding protein [Candidatus Methanoperedens sp.]